MVDERFFASFIHCYFIAFGVIIGGAIIGSIGEFATGNAPLTSIGRIAKNLRIWAIVAAIGGTFDAIANFERGLFDGSTMDIFKQAFLILSAMGGVKTAITLLEWLIQEDIT
ncbi:YtrH family sporulation protein [Virgibacillus sp. NKC19-3]|uniref:YtrH family sporulation protein n=1 Tax=Virgibacillus saliphilus TaxID=2831674 RepID=UPI001C9AF792|nr:YtrH family sporulation protein [Virgibacillus sp. NKC19-3]MBY7143857.1 YtrH family sporulation protein [Virgibacillus sp. NKC19-3]